MVDSRPNVWQLQSRHDMKGLIQALRYPDPEVRGRAAVALRTLDAVPAVPALKAALQEELDEQTRRYLKEALHVLDQQTDVGMMARAADLNGLIAALKSSRTQTVILAAQSLGQLGDRLAVEPLIILFQNTTLPPVVRLAAAEALLDLKSAPAVVTLLGALRRDSWQVRRNAAAVLGQIQAIWAVDPLAEALRDPHPVVRRSAAAALKRIGTTEAITAIREAVRDAQTTAADRADQAKQAEQADEADLVDEANAANKAANRAAQLAQATRAVQRGNIQAAAAESGSRTAQTHEFHDPSEEKSPQFAQFPETEQGEASGAHETHPSESTRPVRVHESSLPPANVESTEGDGHGDSDAEQQTRSPVSRLIDFFRRRGGNDY